MDFFKTGSYDITDVDMKKRKISKRQAFLLGLFIGLGLYWISSNSEFEPAHFTEKPTPSVFAENLPITAPLLQKEGFFISYNGQTRTPHWVYHKLTSATLNQKPTRIDCDFKEDSLIPAHIRATKADYKSAGYDRGHLYPAADSPSQKAMEDSFFLTNVAPQTPAFNRGYWKKLENHVRDLTKKFRTVHAFTGPLYLSKKERNGRRYVKYEVIGKHQVAVPTHFFLLLFVEPPNGKMLTKAYILPNKAIEPSTPLKKFSASVQEIESTSGVMFTQLLD